MAEKTTSLAVQAYEKIKENILNLTYPPGTQLTEAMLTRELGMSRSPIRSAIQMLQTEGLIVSDYYKSMTVREITDQDINELYQIRELLEGAAFKLIFSSGRNEEYSYRIEEKVVRMCATAENPYQWEIADTSMHMEIISIFENNRINKIYENNLSELVRIGQYSVRNGMQITKTNENLKKMIEYMRNGKSEESYEILKTDHFDTGRHSALKAESIEHITQST
ncbi:MAG: GntR family transcriptional regulator [Dorea sp.]|jgi:DNA-binding GntR family transcriptional regulator|nr:GntR family transcriptional regulator [Dorea sp.]